MIWHNLPTAIIKLKQGKIIDISLDAGMRVAVLDYDNPQPDPGKDYTLTVKEKK